MACRTTAFWALAHWTSRSAAQGFYEAWGTADEPGEEGWRLEGDVGLVPLG
ncbi:MAG TPA: hypothetical protein VFV59_05640 [Candidatus Limnocylindria bacterium]|nr:hypothetical protein [Candidatus Limnocylindria bacterium]